MEAVVCDLWAWSSWRGKWQARCRWRTGRSTSLLLITECKRQQTSTTCFVGNGSYWTIVFEVWPAYRSGWHLAWIREFYYISVIHYGRFQSDPLESATIRFRSENRPFSSPERQSAQMSEIKNGGLGQYGAGPFEQQKFGTAGVEGVKQCSQWLKHWLDVH